jgi:hypothetical protein
MNEDKPSQDELAKSCTGNVKLMETGLKLRLMGMPGLLVGKGE